PRPNYPPHDEGPDISPFFYGTYRYIQARSAEADSLLVSRVIGSHWYRQARTSFVAVTTHNTRPVEPVPSNFSAKLKRLPGGALFAVAGSDREPDLQLTSENTAPCP